MELWDEFWRLEQEIINCRRCLRLVEWREKVAREKAPRFRAEKYWGRPLPAFGGIDAKLLIVGLAPAAHGGNRTGRMFTGDRSGEWLFDALHRFGFANQAASISCDDGLVLHQCLITAALRCALPDNKPLPQEINNCREYLVRELQLAKQKKAIVVLGRIAFRAFLKARQEMGGQPLENLEFRHGREWLLPEGTLISSYHPSQQNTQTGKLTRPMFYNIFRRARQITGVSPAELPK
jgi:uracil-DNA glycosylase family 4